MQRVSKQKEQTKLVIRVNVMKKMHANAYFSDINYVSRQLKNSNLHAKLLKLG